MMTYKDYLDKISKAKTLDDLYEIRENILYNERSLEKDEMFLLGEFIQFRTDYVK